MMTSTQILIMFAELFGGLAFFLYGMSTMSSGLEKTAGGRLERTLKRVSKNDFLGTKVLRFLEKRVARYLMRRGLLPEEDKE